MSLQLAALGLPFERIDAIDAQAADLGSDTALISAAERACALSHRRAWIRFLESGEPYAAVFEDDALLAGETAQILARAPEQMPADADILRLETRFQTTLLGRGRRYRGTKRRLRRLHSRHHGAAAYVITRRFAERAVRALTEFAEPVDDLLFNPVGAHFFPNVSYQLWPAVSLQLELLDQAGDNPLRRSDLRASRDGRFARIGRTLAPPKPKVRRSIPEKCIREADRWLRRGQSFMEAVHVRIFTGCAWRTVPFVGTIPAPVAATLSLPGSEQALQLEMSALRLLGSNG